MRMMSRICLLPEPSFAKKNPCFHESGNPLAFEAHICISFRACIEFRGFAGPNGPVFMGATAVGLLESSTAAELCGLERS